MNLEEIAKRAKEVAQQLGTEFSTPDFNASKAKAERHLYMRKEYLTRKEEYDNMIEHIFNTFSKEAIQSFISQNTKS